MRKKHMKPRRHKPRPWQRLSLALALLTALALGCLLTAQAADGDPDGTPPTGTEGQDGSLGGFDNTQLPMIVDADGEGGEEEEDPPVEWTFWPTSTQVSTDRYYSTYTTGNGIVMSLPMSSTWVQTTYALPAS